MGKIEIGCDILPYLYRTMTIRPTVSKKLREWGYKYMRVFLCDQDVMPFGRYNASFWQLFRARMGILAKQEWVPILSVTGYYRVNDDALSQSQWEFLAKKAVIEMNNLFGKDNYMIEIANEPQSAPREWRQKTGLSGMQAIKSWHERMAEVLICEGVDPMNIIVSGGVKQDTILDYNYYLGLAVVGGAQKNRKNIKFVDVMRSYHGFHFSWDFPPLENSGPNFNDYPTRIHLTDDGRSRSGRVGHGKPLPPPIGDGYISTNTTELVGAFQAASHHARSWNMHVIHNTLFRGVFKKHDGTKWWFDMNGIDAKRAKALADAWIEDYIDDEPEPEPEPHPEPTEPEPEPPEPKSFWTKIWNAIKTFFQSLFKGK